MPKKVAVDHNTSIDARADEWLFARWLEEEEDELQIMYSYKRDQYYVTQVGKPNRDITPQEALDYSEDQGVINDDDHAELTHEHGYKWMSWPLHRQITALHSTSLGWAKPEPQVAEVKAKPKAQAAS
jgi:hypothetical protein